VVFATPRILEWEDHFFSKAGTLTPDRPSQRFYLIHVCLIHDDANRIILRPNLVLLRSN